MFGGDKWKSKSLTNSWDFYPDPPNNEKLVFSFLDILDNSDHLCIFFSKQFFCWLDFRPRLTPASQPRWINPTIFHFFFEPFPNPYLPIILTLKLSFKTFDVQFEAHTICTDNGYCCVKGPKHHRISLCALPHPCPQIRKR